MSESEKQETACGYEFKDFPLYCQLPKGHAGDHKANFDGSPLSRGERTACPYRAALDKIPAVHGSGPYGFGWEDAVKAMRAALAIPCPCSGLREPLSAREVSARYGIAPMPDERREEAVDQEIGIQTVRTLTEDEIPACLTVGQVKQITEERDRLREQLEMWHQAFAHALMRGPEHAFTYEINGKSIRMRAREWFEREQARLREENDKLRQQIKDLNQ